MTDLTWTRQQSHALDAVAEWYKSKSSPQVFRLFGFAGTGKTTLAKHFAAGLRSVRYGAFTGKAALQMRKSGCVGASTIHSMTYKLEPPHKDRILELEKVYLDDTQPEKARKEAYAELIIAKKPQFILNNESGLEQADLLIVDEVSMVDEEIGQDLLSFGTKILVLGDPFQLPPIKGAGFFTKAAPDFLLTDIQRQAAENPIIAMSMSIREKGVLPQWREGAAKIGSPLCLKDETLLKYSQILCGCNKTRFKFTDRYRRISGYTGRWPSVGERVIALKNNNKIGLFNGMMGKITRRASEPGNRFNLTCSFIDEEGREHVDIPMLAPRFLEGSDPTALKAVPWQIARELEDFYFSYIITTHKAQGSQFDHVLVLDDGIFGWKAELRETRLRWLYTAVTRAIETVTIVRV